MAGTITVEIIRTNTTSRVCVVKITDNGVVLGEGNLGLKVNPDGTANTAWIIDAVKEVVLGRRKAKAVQDSIDKITSTINTNSEE
ncbi:MAG TPA: hypothetical protein EYN51_06330 [Flavobacteriales bacterium]|nr:hypothetical protein [Flavobacteriales bacterium]